MSQTTKSLNTQLIHAGEPRPRIRGAVGMPIFQSAMFEYAGETDYNALRYIRLNNTPNHEVLHQKLAILEGAESGLVAASGMAAITTSLLTVLGKGGHLLAQSKLYGGTFDFIVRDLPEMGCSYDLVDGNDPGSWESRLKPETRAIYMETMTNPTLEVADHEAVIDFAKKHGLVSLVDNTFASPVNFRACQFGYDLSIHSGTKYLNGHSDIVAGAVLGPSALVSSITHKLNHFGGTLDPHACFLLHRGLKTLGLRIAYQNASAQRIAEFLDAHPGIARVHYPGLASHARHQRAKALFGGNGGVLSFEIGGDGAAAEALIERTRIPIHTFSLGGVETLIIQPAKTSHAGMSARERLAAGVPENLIRLSVGVEDTDDLIADLSQALDAVA